MEAPSALPKDNGERNEWMGKYLPPMHTDCTLRFDILEQQDTILRCTVDRRHDVPGFIRSKNHRSICTQRKNEDYLPNRNEGEIKTAELFSNLLERRAYGHLILIFPVEHGTVPSIAAKEHLDLLRFDNPRRPKRLESIKDPSPREVLAGRASQRELLGERSAGFDGIGEVDGDGSVIPPVQAMEAVCGNPDRGKVVVVA